MSRATRSRIWRAKWGVAGPTSVYVLDRHPWPGASLPGASAPLTRPPSLHLGDLGKRVHPCLDVDADRGFVAHEPG